MSFHFQDVFFEMCFHFQNVKGFVSVVFPFPKTTFFEMNSTIDQKLEPYV